MGLFSFIGSIFKPAADIVDKIHTSDAERLQLRNELARIEAEFMKEYLKVQGQVAEANAKIAAAEATSESWFTRNYRPIIISSMFGMIMLEHFGLLKSELPEIFWQIFAAAFGVMSVTPKVLSAGSDIIKKVLKK